MNEEKSETAVEQPAKVEPQTTEPKPLKALAPKASKVKKAVKSAKKSKTKKATKAPAKSKGKKVTKAAKKTAKPSKVVKQGLYPRHPNNPFRAGSSYGAIFDAFVRRASGIRRDELLKLCMNATGKDAKHASYDMAVILSAKDSKTGPRHPSCREGFYVSRENDFLRLNID